MKKKIYFTVSAILQIIASIYTIININDVIQEQLDALQKVYSAYPVEYREEMVNMLQNRGTALFGIIFCIPIILNAIMIKTAINDNILKKKGMLIAFTIICLFTAESSIVILLSIANLIILLCLQRKNPEDYPVKEKKEIPHLEYQKSSKKEMILGIVLVLVYFSEFLFNFIPGDLPVFFLLGSMILYYVIVFVLAILIFKGKLKRDIKLFKNNAKAYFRFVLSRMGIMYIALIVSNIICTAITKESTSVNQSSIESMPLWYVIPAGVIWAPIVEELIFRGVIRRFLKNNVLYILVSATIFGLLHTIHEPNLLNTIVMAIPYGVIGGFFAYIYAKTDNLTNNILMHFFQNALAMIFVII